MLPVCVMSYDAREDIPGAIHCGHVVLTMGLPSYVLNPIMAP